MRKLITMMQTTKIQQQKTDNFIKQLKRSKAPIQPVITLRKEKTFLPSLKPNVDEELRSSVVNKITCLSCQSTPTRKTNLSESILIHVLEPNYKLLTDEY